jgi:hypothetical protein
MNAEMRPGNVPKIIPGQTAATVSDAQTASIIIRPLGEKKKAKI